MFLDQILTIAEYHSAYDGMMKLRDKLDVREISVYTTEEQNLLQQLDVNIKPMNNRLDIILAALTDNVIIFQAGAIAELPERFFATDNIFADIFADIVTLTASTLKAYTDIGRMYAIQSYINSNQMIIPNTPFNVGFMQASRDIASKLQSTDDELVTNIALTVTNIKYNGYIKNIPVVTPEIAVRTISVPYDHPDYIYYPAFDLSSPKELFDPSILPDYFNTLGQAAKKPDMIAAFNDNKDGTFIKRFASIPIIPKILHQVNLSGSDYDPVLLNAWAKILREPWEYTVWTLDDIREEFADSRWYEFIDSGDRLAAYLAILEKYGGIIMDMYNKPIKLFPENMLGNKFFVSYASSANLDLNYRVMGSVPGYEFIEEVTTEPARIDLSRRAFVAPNNFYRNIAEANLQRAARRSIRNEKPVSYEMDDIVYNPVFFDTIYNLLRTCTDVAPYLRSDPEVMIYPTYYFNPDIYLFPRSLVSRAVLANLWKQPGTTEVYSAKPERRMNVTLDGIMFKLNENPKNRYLQ